ncbi:MAG: class I SAM-dependent methyltransferase [Thermoplasmata archaeon]|nr:class I SAM-dependent methyltransferase [Thermoplasmata archaeon]
MGDAYTVQAEYYDRIYGFRPYREEARALRAIARRGTTGRRWLDVGCGTGTHLRYLQRWYEVAGVEPSSAMRRVARRKLPDVPIHAGRMQEFRLSQRFDVVSCLFSAIGYLPTVTLLERTLRNFARHLAPSGVVLVEPWLFPEQYRPGRLPAVLRRDLPGAILLRMNIVERRGRRTSMVMHHLYGDRRGVRYFAERHESTMFTRSEFAKAFRSAGLRAKLLRPGLSSKRGLYFAQAP